MTSAYVSKPLLRRQRENRRGAALVWSAILTLVFFSMLTLAIDTGLLNLTRTQLQSAVDAAALAGAGTLAGDPSAVLSTVSTYLQANEVLGGALPQEDVSIELGKWDRVSRTFTPTNVQPSAVSVTASRNDATLFFGPVVGISGSSVAAAAVATYRPRDVMLVLDCSGSMNDDSELDQSGALGQANIEDNLWQIYVELGSPTFGSMQWTPQQHSGSNSFIKATLEIESVPYPYPGGSWDDYIDYVQADGSYTGDTVLEDAGYADCFGCLTLVHYWLAERARSSETPDLWMTSHQPFQAVKDGVSEFISYLQPSAVIDRVGVVTYTFDDAIEAKLETGLTSDLSLVEDIVQHRQAKHYRSGTNIGAGIHRARLELESDARPGAERVLILMTDGQANRPGDDNDAKVYVLEQAQLCSDADIAILSLSVGSGADTTLMQQVADITGGAHFNIPGGQSVADYSAQLQDVFRQIAIDRPLELVR